MNKSIKVFFLVMIALIAYLVIQPQPTKQHSKQEINNMSAALSQKLMNKNKAHANANNSNTKPPQSVTQKETATNTQLSIIGVIYKKSDATWFFKAKDSKEKINTISASFKNYFVDQLKFSQEQQPDFSHIPNSMRAENKSSMRVATFIIGDVEVSVSRLAGQQDVFANVQRWMKQIKLNDNSPIQLDFSDDKQTIFVRMPR